MRRVRHVDHPGRRHLVGHCVVHRVARTAAVANEEVLVSGVHHHLGMERPRPLVWLLLTLALLFVAAARNAIVEALPVAIYQPFSLRRKPNLLYDLPVVFGISGVLFRTLLLRDWLWSHHLLRLRLSRHSKMAVEGGQFAVEVGLVLQVVDLLHELVLDLVGEVQLFKALAHLQLQVVICLLDLCDVHFLQLNFTVIGNQIYLPSSSEGTNSKARLVVLRPADSPS